MRTGSIRHLSSTQQKKDKGVNKVTFLRISNLKSDWLKFDMGPNSPFFFPFLYLFLVVFFVNKTVSLLQPKRRIRCPVSDSEGLKIFKKQS